MTGRYSSRPARSRALAAGLLALVLVLGTAVPGAAIAPPDGDSPLAARAMRHPDLTIRPAFGAPGELGTALAAAASAELQALGVARPEGARLDLRGQRWGTLLPSVPLLPSPEDGPGFAGAVDQDAGTLELQAWQALAGYLETHRERLRVDPAELASPGRVAAHSGGELIQIHAPRVVGGVPVRGSYLTAVINHGNLVLLGATHWGDVEVETRPTLDAGEALARLESYLAGETIGGLRGRPRLELVPLARGQEPARVTPGQGYAHRLVWSLKPSFAGERGGWEGLVDAHTGEMIAFEDRNQYATARRVRGGVYPVSNDGAGADGTEQAGWPMPFDALTTGVGTVVTDAGGNAPLCLDGNVTSNLSGPYVKMDDVCGGIGLTSAGDLDFGTSGGDDCTTPGFGGAGNTHASRTGFHELNRIRAQAKGQLPANPWLDRQLTANMNINSSCNAFWDGSTVNFYQSTPITDPPPPPPLCANTGEIAGVFDHEWGHGMDNNDVNPSISSPGEGIADLYAYLRLDTSCIGRGFIPASNCDGFGDACLDCTGVREIDWDKRMSHTPHDVVWADATCGSYGFDPTPCGGSTHCEGQVYAEAVYDLVNRDLPALFGMDHNTALELGTRLTYLGGGPVGAWFQCDTTPPLFGGCNADGGYLNFLAADDDNGDLDDGTPHMSAIFAAFDRHGIACNTPAVANSGCAGTPATAPVVTATARDRGAGLTWGSVTGASKYQVLRTDGVHGCDFGKVKIGETSGTSFVDDGLQNGRAYSYVVIPIGAADTCMGPASSCDTVTPAAGPNLAVDAGSVELALSSGDGDDFLDNCEAATLSFDVVNIGNAAQTNVRIDAVRAVSHPATTIDAIDPVAPAGLAVCAAGTGSFQFTPDDLASGDTAIFEVDLTSDELSPLVKTAVLEVPFSESDLQFAASKLWDFESDLEGWTLVQGTFDQTTSGGGAPPSAGYLASSSFLDDQCDQVRSPPFQLRATSTLSLSTNYEIEEFFPPESSWYDRANVALHEDGARSAVDPDGGRLYNVLGDPNGSCVTQGQNGWADAAASWAVSSWSATALDAVARAGRTVQLDVAYGTDYIVSERGFSFDRVTLTDVDLLVADAQADSCAANTPPTVTISAPPEGAIHDDGDSILFTGTASDAEDGEISASLSWTSDLDGAIGAGGSFSTMLTTGYHTVTAAVTDSGGLSDSDEVHVVVENPPGCVADLPVTTDVIGPATREAVNSVPIGPNVLLDGSAGPVTVEAGNFIALTGLVELRGTVTLVNTPTPCS